MNIVQVTRTFAVALVLVLTATGLWAAGAEEEPATAAEKETVFDPATGMTWTAPEYGGTLTQAVVVFPPSTDNWWNLGWAPHFISGVVERLAFADWGLSREIWDGRVYALNKSTSPLFFVSQPWVEGYFGEAGMGWGERNTFQARLWIDQELKEAMGQ